MRQVTKHIRRHPLTFLLAGSGILLSIGSSISMARAIARRRRRNDFSYRWKKIASDLLHRVVEAERAFVSPRA